MDKVLEILKNPQTDLQIKKMNKTDLFTCHWCNKQYWETSLCPPCRKRRSRSNEVHHGKKAPEGKCQQCLRKDLKLTKYWRNQSYCADCIKWNEEGVEAGVGSYCKRFVQNYCKNCGECASCQARKGLVEYSTRDLMIEVMKRSDFEALLSWEDDGFKQRYGEIMWELEEVKGLASEKIEELVNEDIFKKPVSKRKFSRGT